MVARGGRVWFAVESKSFEISMEEVGENLKGVIVENGRGLLAWIRFGDLSLRCLLEGVEACCKDESLERWSNGWEEEEGDLSWNVERMGLGVSYFVLLWRRREMFLASLFQREGYFWWMFCFGGEAVVLRKDLGVVRDAAWLQLGESEAHGGEEYFRRCLVGGFGESPEPFLELSLLKLYDLLEAERVLARGPRRIKENLLNLVWWMPEVAERCLGRIGFVVEGSLLWMKTLRAWPICSGQGSWSNLLGESCLGSCMCNELGVLEDRDDGVGDSRANYGVGKSLYPLPTGDGDVPCSYMKKLTSEAATVEKAVEGGIVAVEEAVEGGDVWRVTERREEGDDGAALRPFGVAFVDPMFAMTERKEESYEGDLIKCLGSFLALLEVDPPRVAGLGGVVDGEEFTSLPKGFVEFSTCLGLPILGVEKEINSLLRKLEAKKVVGLRCQGEGENPCPLRILRRKFEGLSAQSITIVLHP
ncbi:hypothetical protein CK203_013817 [Vitis vinifera]|uniref:DUF4283 domain-containing protein n=1 Tax=Vitis vinifera TaxID=29760 RepID=A0A438JJ73_VITVI|nr:hypothetical protein CK203_013817 [Vitis vinifera]